VRILVSVLVLQIYSGIDYPQCFVGAATFSTDYFVDVSRGTEKVLDDGAPGPGWQAHWNETKAANHAETLLGTVVPHGNCYSNARTKICVYPR